MSRKLIFFILLITLAQSTCYSQKVKFYISGMAGVELALANRESGRQLKNFNQNNVVFQPIGLSCIWNDRIGLHLEAKVSALLNQKTAGENLLSLEPISKNLYLYSPERRFTEGEVSSRFRLGLIYQIQRNNLSIRPKLLAGVFVFPREQITDILKEQNTNYYYSASFRPVNGKTKDFFLSVTPGFNLTTKVRRRGAFSFELSYSYSNTKTKLTSEIKNLYSGEVSNSVVTQKAIISALSLAMGLSIAIGR